MKTKLTLIILFSIIIFICGFSSINPELLTAFKNYGVKIHLRFML